MVKILIVFEIYNSFLKNAAPEYETQAKCNVNSSSRTVFHHFRLGQMRDLIKHMFKCRYLPLYKYSHIQSLTQ